MGITYILIILGVTSQGPATTQEFFSKARCEYAANYINETNHSRFRAFCVQK